mmetsp:Transcript_10360/g.29532  ORF Transcript_10360/g.29532 Transcript_10360/m.29532 type:complete len:211 (-) Transcript_10360:341-973(-)
MKDNKRKKFLQEYDVLLRTRVGGQEQHPHVDQPRSRVAARHLYRSHIGNLRCKFILDRYKCKRHAADAASSHSNRRRHLAMEAFRAIKYGLHRRRQVRFLVRWSDREEQNILVTAAAAAAANTKTATTSDRNNEDSRNSPATNAAERRQGERKQSMIMFHHPVDGSRWVELEDSSILAMIEDLLCAGGEGPPQMQCSVRACIVLVNELRA